MPEKDETMGEIADALRKADQAGERSPSAHSAPAAPPVVAPPGQAPIVESVEPTEPSIRRATPSSDPHGRSIVRVLGGGGDAGEAICVALRNPHGTPAQQYRRLAFRVREMANERSVRSIVVTSAQAGDGKTTTACNLAVQLVRLDEGSRVVLVDLDLHRAGAARSLGIDVGVSVDSVLRGESSISDAMIETDLSGFSILAQKQPAPNPEGLLAHSSLKAMIRELESRYDFVIIDTPPVLATSDAQIILRYAAAGLLVVRAGKSRVKALRNALEHIPTQKLLGSILNSSPTDQGLYHFPYYAELKQNDDDQAFSDVEEESPDV